MKPSIRDLIPALIVFLFVACLAALLMELLVPPLVGRPTDPTIITALCALLGTCVSGLLFLYAKDTGKPPPPEPKSTDQPALSEEALARARREVKKYLNQITARSPRWKPRST